MLKSGAFRLLPLIAAAVQGMAGPALAREVPTSPLERTREVFERRGENIQTACRDLDDCLAVLGAKSAQTVLTIQKALDQLLSEMAAQATPRLTGAPAAQDSELQELAVAIAREEKLAEGLYALIDQCRAAAQPSGADPAQIANLRKSVKYLTSDELHGRCPGTDGHEKARRYVTDQLHEMGLEVTEQDRTRILFWKPFLHVENVIGLRKSKTPTDKCIVFAAHYDHLCGGKGDGYHPGATDNAASVAALLELARKTGKMDLGADVYFAFPDQEENFIGGSKYIVESLQRKCGKILYNVTLDVVGDRMFKGADNQMLALSADTDPKLRRLIEDAPKDGFQVQESSVKLIEPLGTLVPRSDYASFRKEGVPFIFFTTGTPEYYHTERDSEDKVNYPYLQRFTDYLGSMAQLPTDGGREPSSAEGELTQAQLSQYAGQVEGLLASFLDQNSADFDAKYLERVKAYRTYLHDHRDTVTMGDLQRTVVSLLLVIKSNQRPVTATIGLALVGFLQKLNHL